MKWGWDKGNINQKKLLKGLHFTASLLKWRDKRSILAHLWKSYFAPWIPCSFRKSWGRWPIVLKTRLITAEIGCFLPFVSCKIYIKNHLSWNSTKVMITEATVEVQATDQRECGCQYLWRTCKYKAWAGTAGHTEKNLPPTDSRNTETSLKDFTARCRVNVCITGILSQASFVSWSLGPLPVTSPKHS